MVVQRRSISHAEIAVLRAAFEHAATRSISGAQIAAIEGLRVVSRCDCGCDSVQFEVPDGTGHGDPIADGVASTSAGGRVGVLVFGTDQVISALEIYDLGAGEDGLRLPEPDSIRSWRDAGAA